MAQRDERPGEGADAGTRLPPGQYVTRGWPVLHYGPVPRFRPATWDFRIFGATASGEETVGDPWREQRYSYHELPGEGPEA
jgi:hypothetical protein